LNTDWFKLTDAGYDGGREEYFPRRARSAEGLFPLTGVYRAAQSCRVTQVGSAFKRSLVQPIVKAGSDQAAQD